MLIGPASGTILASDLRLVADRTRMGPTTALRRLPPMAMRIRADRHFNTSPTQCRPFGSAPIGRERRRFSMAGLMKLFSTTASARPAVIGFGVRAREHMALCGKSHRLGRRHSPPPGSISRKWRPIVQSTATRIPFRTPLLVIRIPSGGSIWAHRSRSARSCCTIDATVALPGCATLPSKFSRPPARWCSAHRS